MSSSDYLAGVRDGFAIGFNAGFRKGVEAGGARGYLRGYADGFRDGSLGLPPKPRERLLDCQRAVPDIKPLKTDPLPAFRATHLPEIEPFTPSRLSARDESRYRSRDSWRRDPSGF